MITIKVNGKMSDVKNMLQTFSAVVKAVEIVDEEEVSPVSLVTSEDLDDNDEEGKGDDESQLPAFPNEDLSSETLPDDGSETVKVETSKKGKGKK